jgi:hypothetical protein
MKSMYLRLDEIRDLVICAMIKSGSENEQTEILRDVVNKITMIITDTAVESGGNNGQ